MATLTAVTLYMTALAVLLWLHRPRKDNDDE